MATPIRQLTEWKRLAKATRNITAATNPDMDTVLPRAVIVLVDELTDARARVAELESKLTNEKADRMEGVVLYSARVAELETERESIIKTAENMGGRRPASASDAMDAAVAGMRKLGAGKAIAEAQVAKLGVKCDRLIADNRRLRECEPELEGEATGAHSGS